ncbi:unnamed protein product [Spodoptera littoralis]|uniref:Uncharacterized protein n=1 Tax=Spodoptera littoralis TaxID=7109 RepID=A0A9P0IG10_SPOLI|nr:unnamed protein product [Spodoptera littoralis]CAH1646922.1 unnamed protein product [Spodoptera littoralis]
MYLFNVLLFSILLLNVGAKDHASAHDSHKLSELSIRIGDCICFMKLGPDLNRNQKSFFCKPDETINNLTPDLQQSIKAKCQSMSFKDIKRMFIYSLLLKHNANKNIEKDDENNTTNGKNESNSQGIKNVDKNSTGTGEPRIDPHSTLNENKIILQSIINNKDDKHELSLVPNVNKIDGNNTTNGKNASNSLGIKNDDKNSTGTGESRTKPPSTLNESETIEYASINNTDDKHALSLVPNVNKIDGNNTTNGKNESNSLGIKNGDKNSTGPGETKIISPSTLNVSETIDQASLNNKEHKNELSLVPNVNKIDGNNTTNGKNESNSLGIKNGDKNSTGPGETKIISPSTLNVNETIDQASLNNKEHKNEISLVPNVNKNDGNNTTNGKNESNSLGIKNDDKNSMGTGEPRTEPPSTLNETEIILQANINNKDGKHALSLVPNVNKIDGNNTTNEKNASNSLGIKNGDKNSTGTGEPRIDSIPEIPSSSNLKPKDSIKDKSHVNRTDTTPTEDSSFLEKLENSEAFKYESYPRFYKKNKTILIDVSVLEEIAQRAEHICDCSIKPILKDSDNVNCTAASPFTTLGSSMMSDIDALCEYLNEMISLLNIEKNRASEGNEDFSSDMDNSGIRERVVENSGGANNLSVPQIEATLAPGENNHNVLQPTTTVAPGSNNHNVSQPTTTVAPGSINHNVSQPTTTVAPGSNNHSVSLPTTTVAPGENNHSVIQPTTTVAPGENNHSVVSQPTTTVAPGENNHSVIQPTTTVAPGSNNHSVSQPTTTVAPGSNNHSVSQPTTTVAPGENNHSVIQPTTTVAPEPLSHGTETSGLGPLAKEPEKYSMATILGLGICGFACGILLAIAITMTYIRYRRRVYVTYRP